MIPYDYRSRRLRVRSGISWKKCPDPSRVKISVYVMLIKLLETLAGVNEPSGDGAEIGGRMLDDGLEDRRRALLAFGTKVVRAFHDGPAVVAAFGDPVDHLPQI